MITDLHNLDAIIKFGNDHEDTGRLVEALRVYSSAKEAFPESHLPDLNMGNVFFRLGEYSKATTCYLESLTLHASVPALVNLGNIEYLKKNFVDAVAWYSRTLLHYPDSRQAALGVAYSHIAAGHPAMAQEFLLDWISQGNEEPSVRKLLAELNGGDDVETAFIHLRKIVDWDAECWMLAAKLHASNLNPSQAFSAAIRSLKLKPEFEPARTMAYFNSMLTDATPNDLHELNSLCFPYIAPIPRLKRQGRRPGPIRIGYVSGDYKQHAAANYLYPMIKNHGRNFTPVMISNTKVGDLITEKFKELQFPFVDISCIGTAAAKETIRSLDLDVLCDCSGHTKDNRLDLFDERLAFLQLTFLGCSLATGAPAIDYRIVSTLTDPPEAAIKWNKEKLAWIDGLQGVYHDWSQRPALAYSPFRERGRATIGFVNNQEKLNIDTIDELSAILSRTTANLKMVGIQHPAIERAIKLRLKKHLHRVEIIPRVTLDEYFNHIDSIDFAYDSYPYTGSTTTIDCLLQGVPVISRFGERSHSRSSFSLLKTVGLDDFLFNDKEDRIKFAIALCDNPQSVARYRKELPTLVRNSKIMDAKDFIDRWERLLHELLSSDSVFPN